MGLPLHARTTALIYAKRSLMRTLLSMLLLAAAAQAQSDIQSALSRPILVPNQPLIEVEVYTSAHVASMPSASTPEQWDRISDRIRNEVLNKVILQGAGKRWQQAKTRVEWLDTLPGNGYR